MSLKTIILAAGQGTRMKSDLPKALHTVSGISMLEHVALNAMKVNNSEIIVIYSNNRVKEAHSKFTEWTWAYQGQQWGTGHAVAQALLFIEDDDLVTITCGDTPLVRPETFKSVTKMVDIFELCLLTMQLDDPTGYGRIIRDSSHMVCDIVEEKDATEEQLKITEVNTGIMCVKGKYLKRWVPMLQNDNSQGEYYLTDLIRIARDDGSTIMSQQVFDRTELIGVNTQEHLAEVQSIYLSRNN